MAIYLGMSSLSQCCAQHSGVFRQGKLLSKCHI